MTWFDEIIPWRNWKGWCMALALIFYLSIPAVDDMRTEQATNFPPGELTMRKITGKGSL